MRVLYDSQGFELQASGGISRYFYELANHFYQHDMVEISLEIKYTDNIYLTHAPFVSNLNRPKHNFLTFDKFLQGYEFRGKYHLFNLMKSWGFIKDVRQVNQKACRSSILRQKYDIFHPTYYDPYFLEDLGRKPFVLTIYDLTHEIYPEYFPLNDQTKVWKKLLAKKAAKIIAISENTKKDIIQYLGVEEDKIRTIYLGGSFDLTERSLGVSDPGVLKSLPSNYILYVGTRTRYKNFYFFIESMREMLEQDKELSIICVGGGGFNREEFYYFKNLNIEGQVFQYAVNDATLSELYKRAKLFVFPSLYEGFGIPILEAFQSGCPVAVSNTSSLPEVGGDAAIYFNPKDILSIQHAVSVGLNDESLRKRMKENGFQRLKKFSWLKTAELTAHLYQEVVEERA